MSGWRDSNSRPRRPERRALTGLRYTPKPHILTIYAPKPHAKVQTFFHPPTVLSPILRADTTSHRSAPIVNAAQRAIATRKRQASSQLAPAFAHLHTQIAPIYPHSIPTFPSLQFGKRHSHLHGHSDIPEETSRHRSVNHPQMLKMRNAPWPYQSRIKVGFLGRNPTLMRIGYESGRYQAPPPRGVCNTPQR